MKVAIIGTGYVGLPTGIGLSELGNQVVCIDKIEEKIRSLQNGKATIYEDGMEDLFQKNLASGRLSFTTDMRAGVKGADVVMIAVGTSGNQRGRFAIYLCGSRRTGSAFGRLHGCGNQIDGSGRDGR